MSDELGPMWVVDEAWRQVQRAQTPEDRARSLSTFRRSIATAQKHLGATEPLLRHVRDLENEAEKLYHEVADEHVRLAVRGLASYRMALETRIAATGGTRPGILQIAMAGGTPIASIPVGDMDEVAAGYGIPEEHRGAGFVVQLGFGGDYTVTAKRGRKIVWMGGSKE
jgi:hypothetical protein